MLTCEICGKSSHEDSSVGAYSMAKSFPVVCCVPCCRELHINTLDLPEAKALDTAHADMQIGDVILKQEGITLSDACIAKIMAKKIVYAEALRTWVFIANELVRELVKKAAATDESTAG